MQVSSFPLFLGTLEQLLHGFLYGEQAKEAHVEQKSPSCSNLKCTWGKLPTAAPSPSCSFLSLKGQLSLGPGHWALPTHSTHRGMLEVGGGVN